MAPEVFCTSPQLSPRAPAEPPTRIASTTNWISTPGVMLGSW